VLKDAPGESWRPEWAALVEVLYELEQQPYANPVGRTIFQKICFIPEAGVGHRLSIRAKELWTLCRGGKRGINVLCQ